MDKKISIQEIIKNFKTSNFLLGCQLPMGYVTGYPVLQIKNGSLCLLIPFLKYKSTGKVDKTLVYPIRYTVCMELPEEKVVGFSDLACAKCFEKVDFSRPIGFFRHESIRNLNKSQYKEKRTELYEMYDKLAASLLYGDEYTAEDDEKFKALLRLLVEPCQYQLYRVLDGEFYNKYLRD